MAIEIRNGSCHTPSAEYIGIGAYTRKIIAGDFDGILCAATTGAIFTDLRPN